VEKVFSTAAPPLFGEENLYLFFLPLFPPTDTCILTTPHCPVADIGQNTLSCAKIATMQLNSWRELRLPHVKGIMYDIERHSGFIH